MDRFYTPLSVARDIARAIDVRAGKRPKIVLDVSAGDGELLRATEAKYSDASFIAADIDGPAVRRLRRKRPSWTVLKCDFLDHARRAHVFEHLRNRVSVIVMNPPFSCRGGSGMALPDSKHRCSKAIAFFFLAIELLAPDGQLIALLPAGSIKSERDREILGQIRALGNVDIVREYARGTFEACVPRTVLVRFRKGVRTADSTPLSAPQHLGSRVHVSLVRGGVQMHSYILGREAAGYPLVHSTELRKNRVQESGVWLTRKYEPFAGPAVLVPRVGTPSPTKVAVLPTRRQVVLSDCVVGIRCRTRDEARVLSRAIKAKWKVVSSAYVGTCAQYTTISRLTSALWDLGYVVHETNGEPAAARTKEPFPAARRLGLGGSPSTTQQIAKLKKCPTRRTPLLTTGRVVA